MLVLADMALTWLGSRALPLLAHAALWGGCALLAARAARPYGERAALAGAAAFALVGLLLVWLPFGRAKAFHRAVDRVRPGMSRADVASRLSGSASQSDDPLLGSTRERERWYSEPWFAVCDVEYDRRDRVTRVSTFAFDPPPSSIPWPFGRAGGTVTAAPR